VGKNLKIWSFALCILVFCAVVEQAQAQMPDGAKPVRVGLITPLTGGSSDFGNSTRFGAELAVAEINEVGGYMGRKFELIVRDDESTPAAGLKAAEDLVLNGKADFTLGFCNTGVAMSALHVFQQNKHLLMVPCAQGTSITTKYSPADSYVFRVAPPDLLNAKFLIAEIVDRRKLKRVAIFADSTGYGEGGLNDLIRELDLRGLKPVYTARFPLGVTTLTEEMKTAKTAGAEAIVVYAVGPEQATAAKSRLAAGVQAPYFAPWPLSFRSVLENAGARAIEGTMMVQTIVQDNLNERRASFIARYFKQGKERRFGSLIAAAQSYDAVHIMLRALLQTKGATSGDLLKNALENLRPYKGVVTSYLQPFTRDDHDAIGLTMLWLGVWRNGNIEYFYPEDARSAGVVRRKNL